MLIDISVDGSYCKGCGICIEICPKKVYKLSKKRGEYGNPMPDPVLKEECILCGLCERMCPDGAINVKEERK